MRVIKILFSLALAVVISCCLILFFQNKPVRSAKKTLGISRIDRLDHVLIKVKNLPQVMCDFQDAGFQVFPGSKEGYYNALIYFQDCTFIELIDDRVFPDYSGKSIINSFRFLRGITTRKTMYWSQKKGRIIDYALHTGQIEEVAADNNQALDRVHRMTRTDVMGNELNWKLLMSKDPYLPFLMTDYYPVKLPTSDACNHSNGVTGISSLKIKTPLGQIDLSHSFKQSFDLLLDKSTLSLQNAEVQYVNDPEEEMVLLEGGKVNLSEYGIIGKL